MTRKSQLLFISTAAAAALTCGVLAQTSHIATALKTRIIDGRSYVAVRDLQTILNLKYDASTKTVSIQKATPFIGAAQEGSFGGGQPYDSTSLGAIFAVRQSLNAAQQQSLTTGPEVLLRYEIVGSGYADVPSALQQGFPNNFRPPFSVTVLLYWVPTDQGLTTTFTRRSDPTVITQISVAGPKLGEARVELRRYITAPQHVQQDQKAAIIKAQGWSILSQTTLPLPPEYASRTPASLYDPSLQTVDAAQVRQGNQYPALK